MLALIASQIREKYNQTASQSQLKWRQQTGFYFIGEAKLLQRKKQTSKLFTALYFKNHLNI